MAKSVTEMNEYVENLKKAIVETILKSSTEERKSI